MDQRYREAFDAGLEFMMTPQVDLAAERARDRITPSQPSREVERQKYSRAMDTLFLIWVGFILCMAFAGLLITAYQAVFP